MGSVLVVLQAELELRASGRSISQSGISLDQLFRDHGHGEHGPDGFFQIAWIAIEGFVEGKEQCVVCLIKLFR